MDNQREDNQRAVNDLLKKVDGHFEVLRGKLMEAEGEHVKGGLATAGGKMEDKVADIDMANLQAHQDFVKHLEQTKRKIKEDINHALK